MQSINWRAPWRTVAVSALLIATVTGCGKKDADDTAAVPPSGTAAGNTSASTVAVSDVKLGEAIGADRRVTDESDDFDPGDTIYASVLTTGAAPNATLHARWTFQDGQVVDSTTQAIAPTGDAATEFHISKPGGFPKGTYKLTVLLNGAEVRTKEFKVD